MNRSDLMLRDPVAQSLTTALAAPFEPREVKYKPQMVKNNRCLATAYIDARVIQDRLDEVLGGENWEDCYRILADGSVMCRLRCKLGERWITKTDVGSPSEQPDSGDRLKAAFSDALKRAAVKFGIGRYIYRLPAQWVDYDPVKKQILQQPTLPASAVPRTKPPTSLPIQSGLDGMQTSARSVPAAQPAVSKPDAPNQAIAIAAGPKVETGTAVKAELAPTVRAEPAKLPDAPKSSGLPVNGQELYRRLREYDAKLAAQKLCAVGALLTHVSNAGVKAGFTPNVSEWTGSAIPFAVNVVKEFEQSVRQDKPEPRPVP